jgi:hypothetical protein
MRILFALIGLLGFSLSATADKGWLFYDNYPWVYDNITQDWLYLKPHTNGKLYAYRHSTSLWEEFSAHKHEKTWDEQYEEWVQNPEPYGGLSVLQQIKEAKDSGATELTFVSRFYNITDLTPLAGLTNLTELDLSYNNISDLSPLAGLTNLTELGLSSNNISDITPLAGLTNLRSLSLHNNNISDITPLAGLTNLTELVLSQNNISDISPLAGLTNLTTVSLWYNNISDSQKAMLEEALPNTTITW